MTRFDELRSKAGTGWSMPDRRALLIGGGAAAGLVVAWAVWPRTQSVPIAVRAGEHLFGPYLKIGSDGHIEVLVPQLEMGQGAFTLISQMAADELGADWRTISVTPAPLSATYANAQMLARDAALVAPRFAVPESAASIGVWQTITLPGAAGMITDCAAMPGDFEQPVRECAAVARAMLCMAAAARWDADWQQCETSDGFVTLGQQRLRFGELAAAAAEMSPPSFPPLRAPGSGALFGQSAPRLDLPSKIDGSFAYAADIRLPDMVYAATRLGPIGESRLIRYDRTAADRITGFLAAVRHDGWLAAVATNSWAAQRALNAMEPVFSTVGQRAESAVIDRRLKAAIDASDGVRMVDDGDVAGAMTGRPVLSADYVVAPMLPASIETRSATAAFDGARLMLWVASQSPGVCRDEVAAALGLSASDVTLFNMPAGGNSGAAMDNRVAVQAALITRAMHRPVQLIWSRTEDILQSLPRAPARARMTASLSSGATVDAWHAGIAIPATRHEWRARMGGMTPDDAAFRRAARADAAAVAGARPPYQIPHLAIDHLPVDVSLPSGQLRGGSSAVTTFFTECFVDELARAAGANPLGFRMSMLGDAPALARCLQSVAELGGWDGGQAGSGHGLACASLDGSHIAVMAAARPGPAGLVVERLVAAVDIGQPLNPGLARQQIEGGLIAGLAAAVGVTTRYRAGLARARQMKDIGLPGFGQAPQISVEILPSSAAPGGFGQIGVPPVAPAIANALFTVTGQRLRRMPLSTKALP